MIMTAESVWVRPLPRIITHIPTTKAGTCICVCTNALTRLKATPVTIPTGRTKNGEILPAKAAAMQLIAVAPPREKSRLPWAITKAAPTLATITSAACMTNVSMLESVRNLPPVVRLNSKNIMMNPIKGTADLISNFFISLFLFISSP